MNVHKRTHSSFEILFISVFIFAFRPSLAMESQASIAAKYHNDIGIAGDPNVIFFDDLESWKGNGTRPASGKWSVRKNRPVRN